MSRSFYTLSIAQIHRVYNAVITQLLRQYSKVFFALLKNIGVLALSPDRRCYQTGILAYENCRVTLMAGTRGQFQTPSRSVASGVANRIARFVDY